MNRLINGSEYREVMCGILLKRGKREVHLLGTSAAQIEQARKIIATFSFDRIYKSGKVSPNIKNSRYLTLRG